MDHQENKARREIEEPLVGRDREALKAMMVFLAEPAPSAQEAPQVYRVPLVQKVPKVLWALLVLKDNEVFPVLLVLLVLQVKSFSHCPSRGARRASARCPSTGARSCQTRG